MGGNTQATVTFTAPTYNGGTAITSYTATSAPGNLSKFCIAPCTAINVTGLANGTAYTFTVQATNAVGTSLASASSNPVTPMPTVPDAPINVAAVGGNMQAIVTFAAPANNGGSAITGYTVTSSTGGITASCAASPCTVTGLTNGIRYTFTVKATNAIGTSLPSAPSNSVMAMVMPNVYYIHTDHLDTAKEITDTNGAVVWQWGNVDPFGANMPNENPAGVGTFNFNLRFPGQYYDKETGLHQNYFRDGYNPAIGGYTQFDPIGLRGGINGYTYVRGNPISRVDPSGLVDWKKLGFGAVDFSLSTAEAATGLGIMIGSPVVGPAAPVSYTGGFMIAAHGELGMVNSGIAIQNALNDTSGPGFLEYVGGALFGDAGAKIGAAGDLFLGVRPAAIAAGGLHTVGDVYDLASGINTMGDSFSTKKSCP